MRGLLIKDFKLLKNQAAFFAVVAVCCVGYSILYDNAAFAITMMMAFSMFTLSTISYDEYDNGMAFLFTLPFSRSEYVREKYVFGVLTSVSGLVVFSAIALGILTVKNSRFDLEEWVIGAVVGLLVTMLLLAITIPVQLKFGSERCRIALLAVIGGCVLAAYIASILVRTFGLDIVRLFNKIAVQSPALLIAGGCLAGALVVALSYLVSLKIVKKKQF